MKKIRQLMQEQGLELRDLVYHARIAEATARSLYSGKQTRFDGPILIRVARVLNVTVSQLFEGYEDSLSDDTD
jgi:transcriptional regulator with XRE-family HTH domain